DRAGGGAGSPPAGASPLRLLLGGLLVGGLLGALLLGALLPAGAARAGEPAGEPLVPGFPGLLERVKASVVGVGTVAPLRTPREQLRGTGFVVGDGRHVATNLHVLPEALDAEQQESLAVFLPALPGRPGGVRLARREAADPHHDLVLLRITDAPLPALRVGDSDRVREGELYAFTGFPIGAVLGLYPVTHRALISAITPVAIPQGRAKDLTPGAIRRLRDPYPVFQLDGTAYPGNSGSPLYDPRSGEVVGILNKIFVAANRELALSRPAGIAFAIPARHLRALLERAGLEP
ncbi:MAG: serine protease, partial [Gammaproteobacteria bacterium]